MLAVDTRIHLPSPSRQPIISSPALPPAAAGELSFSLKEDAAGPATATTTCRCGCFLLWSVAGSKEEEDQEPAAADMRDDTAALARPFSPSFATSFPRDDNTAPAFAALAYPFPPFVVSLVVTAPAWEGG